MVLVRTVHLAGTDGPQGTADPTCCSRMVDRRVVAADLPHSFRVTVATDLLEQSVPLEDVQYLLGNSDARTTKQYDLPQRKVTRNTVERISV